MALEHNLHLCELLTGESCPSLTVFAKICEV